MSFGNSRSIRVFFLVVSFGTVIAGMLVHNVLAKAAFFAIAIFATAILLFPLVVIAISLALELIGLLIRLFFRSRG